MVDFFCRGVPSIFLWKAYKSFVQRKFSIGDFKSVNFKDKFLGWHKFSMQILDTEGNRYSETVYDDLFWSFYLKNTCLNEACYDCPFRHNSVYSDIRVGDFWGEKYYHHDEGVSIVVICSERGKKAWKKVRGYFSEEKCYPQDILHSQRFNKFPKHEKYDKIIESLCKGENLEDIYLKFCLDKQGFYKG